MVGNNYPSLSFGFILRRNFIRTAKALMPPDETKDSCDDDFLLNH
jgi:hypothetical protein